MIDRDEAEQLIADGGHLFTEEDSDLGAVARVYLDEYTGLPSFLTIVSSVPGQESLVALHQANLRPYGVKVPYSRHKIDQAPRVGQDRDLTIEEEDALFDYYDVPIDGSVPTVAHLGTVLEASTDNDDVNATALEH